MSVPIKTVRLGERVRIVKGEWEGQAGILVAASNDPRVADFYVENPMRGLPPLAVFNDEIVPANRRTAGKQVATRRMMRAAEMSREEAEGLAEKIRRTEPSASISVKQDDPGDGHGPYPGWCVVVNGAWIADPEDWDDFSNNQATSSRRRTATPGAADQQIESAPTSVLETVLRDSDQLGSPTTEEERVVKKIKEELARRRTAAYSPEPITTTEGITVGDNVMSFGMGDEPVYGKVVAVLDEQMLNVDWGIVDGQEWGVGTEDLSNGHIARAHRPMASRKRVDDGKFAADSGMPSAKGKDWQNPMLKEDGEE